MKNLSQEIANATETLNVMLEINRPNASTKRKITLVQKKIASMQLELDAQPKLMLNAPAQDEKKKLSQKMIDTLSALNISESIKSNADRKTIFKKEFNNKQDRTKCRNKFLNAISLYMLFLSKGNASKAEENLIIAKDCALKYYNAEDTFTNASDYCSNTMDENKRNLIGTFIELQKELA